MVAAVAVPRYQGFETQARVAAVENMGGKLKSAALMAHAVCQAQSCANNQTIVIQGQSITFPELAIRMRRQIGPPGAERRRFHAKRWRQSVRQEWR